MCTNMNGSPGASSGMNGSPGARSGRGPSESFDEIYAAMQEDQYWIGFFVRPRCPAPKLEVAIARLDALMAEVNERTDFTGEQKEQLAALIEARKEWYPNSGLSRVHRSSMAVG